MVGHDDEVVESESSGADARAENVDQQSGVLVGLEETFAHVSFGGHEKSAIGAQDVFGIGIA